MAAPLPDLSQYKTLEDILTDLEVQYGVTDILKWRARELLDNHKVKHPLRGNTLIYPPQAAEWLANYRKFGTPVPKK